MKAIPILDVFLKLVTNNARKRSVSTVEGKAALSAERYQKQLLVEGCIRSSFSVCAAHSHTRLSETERIFHCDSRPTPLFGGFEAKNAIKKMLASIGLAVDTARTTF